MSRRRRLKPKSPIPIHQSDCLSHLYDIDGRLTEFEQQWSATPFDPTCWVGWRIDRLGPGWVATRAR